MKMNESYINSTSKEIAYLGVGIALYVALSMLIKIPLIGHIQTDFGYIVFSVFLILFGWKATVVGVVGCLLESLIVNGWVPVGWMLGQVVIGLICGYVFTKVKSDWKRIIAIIISVFIGIVIIKTGVECWLYQIPLFVKIPKNIIAFVADSLTMIVGIYIGKSVSPVQSIKD